MNDFREATALTSLAPGRWQAQLYNDWALWGPAGGFLTALALRAAGATSQFERPVSLSCQFLSVAKFEPVELSVTSLRTGKRSEALRVDLLQQDRLVLTALIWAAAQVQPGSMMEHDYCDELLPPAPKALKSYTELYPERTQLPFMARMEQRPIEPKPANDLSPTEPEINSLFRWQGGITADDLFVDAGRLMMFMDTHAWLATYAAHPSAGPSPWIAPNLDYYYQFHRPTNDHDWVHMKNRADLACNSLIATQGEIRGLDGRMLMRGQAQLLCSNRPAQFRS